MKHVEKDIHGFTLIETLVAVTILTIAIVGPYSIAHTAIRTARVSQDDLVASYLAQEGIEIVHAIRDDNLLARVSGTDSWRWWLEGAGACVSSECMVDAQSFTVTGCQGEAGYFFCAPLYMSDTGVYNQQESGTESKFTRSVRIDEHYYGSITEATVSVRVSWLENTTPRSVTLQEHLYDWLGYGM